jgi:hypothetical protein
MRWTCLLVGVAFLAFLPSGGSAKGFGTPTLDGLLTGDESIYNSPEASDAPDAPQGNANMDLAQLYVANDDDYWYFLFTILDDVSVTDWGRYMLFVDKTNNTSGATGDPWGRNLFILHPHQAEYSLRGWVDAMPYGPEDTEFWEWDGAQWNQNGTGDAAAINTGPTSGIEWKLARSRIGDPDTMWVEVVSTGDQPTDNVQDTVNDPTGDWNATDWTTTSLLKNSTQVEITTAPDTTPPTIVSGCVTYDPEDPEETGIVDIVYSEAVEPLSAILFSNYEDVNTGLNPFVGIITPPNKVQIKFTSGFYGFGSCEQIKATGVKDLAGNEIIDDGVGNVLNFYLYQVLMRGRMNLHMQAHDVPPHTFALEGNLTPLTWDPLCDIPLGDADGDSTHTAEVFFCLPCSTLGSGPEVGNLEYKFTHQCSEYESIPGNHSYVMDLATTPSGVDTLDIWWDDATPVVTTGAVDVVFRVQSAAADPPFGAGDSLGVDGSEIPLSWDLPPLNLLLDDGVSPDESQGDGVFTTRLTFPAGTLKNVQFRYALKALADTLFDYECSGQGNRSVFLDDSLFSTTNPILLDVAYYNDCLGATGVEDYVASTGGLQLESNRPNPARPSTVISYTIPEEARVTLDVYDVRGRLVRRLVDEVTAPGRYDVAWNGRTGDGRPLPSGLYFYRVKAGDLAQSRKLLLMR